MSASATSRPAAVASGVWADLVGQERAVASLRRAVAGESHAMTHAWLITGPPGSGRSNAARAFAAALQCDRGGCGACHACTTALSGAHPDVTLVRTEQLSIGVDEVRDLVRRAAMAPLSILSLWRNPLRFSSNGRLPGVRAANRPADVSSRRPRRTTCGQPGYVRLVRKCDCSTTCPRR